MRKIPRMRIDGTEGETIASPSVKERSACAHETDFYCEKAGRCKAAGGAGFWCFRVADCFSILEQKKGLMGIGASVTIEATDEPPVAAETPAPAAEPMPEPQAAAPVVEETVETITETVVETGNRCSRRRNRFCNGNCNSN